ncbi:MAG: beta strand repeat-containing protein [Gammaproteobacteria bacterium]
MARLHPLVLALASAGLTFSAPLHAASMTWDAAGSGNYATSTNWNTDTTPGASDYAYINGDLNALPTVSVTANADAYSLYLGTSANTGAEFRVENAATFTNARTAYFGQTTGTRGDLTVTDGATFSSGDSILFAAGVDSSSAVEVSNGGTVNVGANDYYYLGNGANTTATLDILSGGQFNADYYGYIAQGAGSTATINVSGTNSNFVAGRYVELGQNGTATLTVDNGGTVSTSGYGRLTVGSYAGGVGTLNVGDGGTASLTEVYIGNAGQGEINVTGTGSLTASSDVQMGVSNGGQGSLTVSGGASANLSRDLRVGVRAAYDVYERSTGTVTVTGAGSDLSVGYDIEAGPGDATISVLDGATASARGVNLGYSGGTATVNVDDAQLTLTSTSYIGNAGEGTLNITGGSSVSGGYTYLGYNTGSSGALNVEGAGSQWTSNSTIAVGYYGDGTIDVSNGAGLQATSLVLGDGSGTSSGSVSVDGVGSDLTLTAHLYVGDSGVGDFSLTGGAQGQAVNLYVGYANSANPATNTALIDGAGTRFTASTGTNVGGYGKGELTVSNGAVLDAATLRIGDNSSGTGLITVGDGSTLNALGVNIGYNGNGDLVLEQGATLTATSGTIGTGYDTSGNVGRLTMASGATATTTGGWSVGTYRTDGEININGGTFTAGTGLTIGSNVSSGYQGTGTVVVDGDAEVDVGSHITLRDTGALTLNSGRLTADTLYLSSGSTVTLSGGELEAYTVYGDILSSGARVAPGNSPGTLAITGNYSQDANSVLEIEIGGTTPGTEHDVLDVAGDLTLAGTLELMLIDAFVPPINTTLDILDWDGSLSGTFDNVYSLGATWDLSQLYVDGTITLLSYDDMGVAPANTGSYGASAVPTPAVPALLLAGLAFMGWRRARFA